MSNSSLFQIEQQPTKELFGSTNTGSQTGALSAWYYNKVIFLVATPLSVNTVSSNVILTTFGDAKGNIVLVCYKGERDICILPGKNRMLFVRTARYQEPACRLFWFLFVLINSGGKFEINSLSSISDTSKWTMVSIAIKSWSSRIDLKPLWKVYQDILVCRHKLETWYGKWYSFAVMECSPSGTTAAKISNHCSISIEQF